MRECSTQNTIHRMFQGNVYFKNLHLTNLSNVNFENMKTDVVYRNETDVHLTGWKIFANGFFVTHILNADNINNIYVDHILTKNGDQEILGPLNIFGDVLVQNNCEVDDNFNGVLLSYLTRTFSIVNETFVINGNGQETCDLSLVMSSANRMLNNQFCEINDEYFCNFRILCSILDDVMFDRLTYIDVLLVGGRVNGEDIQEYFKDVVFVSSDEKLTTNITFANIVRTQ